MGRAADRGMAWKGSGMMERGEPGISVVLPVYNERENLELLLGEIRSALAGAGLGFEVVAVDDGSEDGSGELLEALRLVHPELRVVRHDRNYGQSAALATGWGEARGVYVVTLDADRQHDPSDVPRMLAALTEGVEAVVGVRRVREDPGMRRWSSWVANRYRDWWTGVRVQDAGCGLRVIRREVLREIPLFNGMHRFLPTLLAYQGYRFVEMEIHHRPRVAGKSKYDLRGRLWRGIRDCLAMRWYRARALSGRRKGRGES